MVKKSILAKVGDVINYKLIRDGYKTAKANVVVTAEMDTKTTIVADVPSTTYTSNLDYEVDISGENPPIINIKNDITCPDDTVISKGKYLFYDIGQEYAIEDKNKIIEPIKNYTKVGNINVDSNGIASNFSTSNYIKLNTYLPSTFDIIIKYKHNDLGSQTGELIANPTDDNSLYIVYSSEQSRYEIILYVKGVSASFETNNPIQYETGSWYWIRLIYNGDEAKIYAIKDNNYTIKTLPPLSSWSHEKTKPVSNLWKNMYVTIGANIPYGKYNTGSIDLNNTYIYELGTSYTSYLKGIKDLKLQDTGTELTTKLLDYHYREEIPYKVNLTKIGNISVNPDGTVSNFSTSNYLRMLDKPSSSTTNFEMLFHFKCTSFSNSEILMGDSGNVWNNVLIYVYNNRFQIGNNRYWYTGTHDIQLNKEYWGKVIFNNGTLSSYISEDGITYEQDYTGSLSSYTWINNADIGYSAADNIAFKGTIWLEDCYVQYGNEEKKYFAERPRSNDKTSLYINSEKDDDLYYDSKDLKINTSKIGNPTIDNKGVVSGFSTSDYLSSGITFNPTGKWEQMWKFTTSTLSGYQRITGTPTDMKGGSNIVITGRKIQVWITSNNSSWDIANGDSTAYSSDILSPNTTYWVKFTFDLEKYVVSYSTDGKTFTDIITVNNSNICKSIQPLSIGCGSGNYPFRGSIDLLNSYIQIGDDKKQYMAELISNRHDIPSLYSEFINNITIPTHALYEYVNGEWKLSGDSPVITQDVTVNADNAEITMKEIEE